MGKWTSRSLEADTLNIKIDLKDRNTYNSEQTDMEFVWYVLIQSRN